jgi:putative adenylate-forming enzyme
LAEVDLALSPQHIFSGAEVLDTVDRTIIETRFGLVVREIYMATEGLFAVACPRGTLHLVEDMVKFEWAPGPDGAGLFTPRSTDFTRTTQMMVRYRMNDLLRLSPEPCACGSAFQPIAEIVGRMDDVFEFCRHGRPALVTPDVFRDAVVGADRAIDDFRVRQTGPDCIELVLPPRHAERLPKAKAAIEQRLARLGLNPLVTASAAQLAIEGPRKLRRVERVWKP